MLSITFEALILANQASLKQITLLHAMYCRKMQVFRRNRHVFLFCLSGQQLSLGVFRPIPLTPLSMATSPLILPPEVAGATMKASSWLCGTQHVNCYQLHEEVTLVG
jgi:hypothetical protein